jgi:uncharacterized protein (TIGR02246 family)
MNKFALMFAAAVVVPSAQAQQVQVQQPAPVAPAREEAADGQEQAIREVIASFKTAFDKADADTIAALCAEDAQVVGPEGNAVKGRAAILQQFQTYFAENPGATVELDVQSLRFLTPDVAQEEGVARVTTSPDAEPGESRYSVLYVRKDGKWLQQEVRDYPSAAAVAEGTEAADAAEIAFENPMSRLDWLIGEWVDESPTQVITHRCRYILGGKYIVREYSTSYDENDSVSGAHVIGYDPQSGLIKSWGFDAEGSHGEALWTRDGDRWVIKMNGVLGDGRTVSATQILEKINNNSLRMVSLERTLGDTMAPDRDEVILVRKPLDPGVIEEAAPAPEEAAPAPAAAPEAATSSAPSSP